MSSTSCRQRSPKCRSSCDRSTIWVRNGGDGAVGGGGRACGREGGLGLGLGLCIPQKIFVVLVCRTFGGPGCLRSARPRGGVAMEYTTHCTREIALLRTSNIAVPGAAPRHSAPACHIRKWGGSAAPRRVAAAAMSLQHHLGSAAARAPVRPTSECAGRALQQGCSYVARRGFDLEVRHALHHGLQSPRNFAAPPGHRLAAVSGAAAAAAAPLAVYLANTNVCACACTCVWLCSQC